jgi:D-tyrosyl-tRNA(Tyr) deacylase
MRAVVQRVLRAEVSVDGAVVGRIGPGLLAFVGVGREDDESDARYLVDKIAGLRVFVDDSGKMSRALGDCGGALLVVSQFTLYGDLSRGRRPSFDSAMLPAPAERLYDTFVALARARLAEVATGQFGADMRVQVDNDGPVTLILSSPSEARIKASGHAERV